MIQVSVKAEGPVRVLRFSDEMIDESLGDQSERKRVLNCKLLAADAELQRYQEEHGVLVNVMLGGQVRPPGSIASKRLAFHQQVEVLVQAHVHVQYVAVKLISGVWPCLPRPVLRYGQQLAALSC